MRKLVFASPLLALLAGCVPSGIVPEQKPIPADSLGLGNEPTPKIEDAWWQAFGDPELDRLVKEALAKNPSLGEALARMRAAKAQVSDANSQLYPHLDFNGSEERELFSNSYIIPPPYAGTYRWYGDIEGDLSWNIDLWGKEAAELDKAKSLSSAARSDSDAARLAISAAVVQAYINLDRAYKLDDIAAENEADRKNTLALTERRVRDGLDSQVEEQEAQALYAQSREARVLADNNRDIVVHEIAALIGHGADAYAAVGRPALKLDAAMPLPSALPADLLARRPDIAATEARVEAALAGRKAAKAAFYPNVDLLASAGWAAIGMSPMFMAKSFQMGAGPAVHLPIFDAGELRAQYAGATADIDMSVADYNGAITNAVRQTADALTRIRSIEGQEVEHKGELDAAEKGFRLAQTRYSSGLSNQLTVLDAENVVNSARETGVSLAADAAVQRVTLVVAVGGGLQHQQTAPASAK